MQRNPLNKAEPVNHLPLRIRAWIAPLLVGAAVFGAHYAIRDLPDRVPGPERLAEVRYRVLPAPVGMALWVVDVNDRRWGGESALAIDRGRLLMLSDSGVAAWLPVPGAVGNARIKDIAAGPGTPVHKARRDSEAMLRANVGWWVSFENKDSLWWFDRDFARGRQAASLAWRDWDPNTGAEALLANGKPGAGVRMLAEARGETVRVSRQGMSVTRIAGLSGNIADAVRLADGRELLLVRELGVRGIVNRLAWLRRERGADRAENFATLPLGPLDNAEGVAAEVLAGGATRLWIVTDNDQSRWRETKLLTMVVPAARAGAGSRPSPG